jgi:hypothetical protein
VKRGNFESGKRVFLVELRNCAFKVGWETPYTPLTPDLDTRHDPPYSLHYSWNGGL